MPNVVGRAETASQLGYSGFCNHGLSSELELLLCVFVLCSLSHGTF